MPKYHTYFIISIAALSIISVTCSDNSFRTSLYKSSTKKISTTESSHEKSSLQAFKKENIILSTDFKRLKSFSSELESMKAEMEIMREESRVWDLDYFPPEEHDKIESFLFRYLVLRNALWDMVNFYKDYREHFSDPVSQTKGFIIGYNAGLHLTSYGSLLVATFINEPMGKNKLNEAYPRSDIPKGTYDMILSNVTSIDHIEVIKVAWKLFCNEKGDTDSTLYRIYRSSHDYKSLIDQITELYKKTETRISFILDETSILLPEATNRLRHTIITQLAIDMKNTLGDNLYAIRSLLFTKVSDIKLPLTKPLSFSHQQKELVHSLLKPGDIILTYTAGYLSNIFLPGVFKHGITYIGTLEQRKQIGTFDDPSSIIKGINVEKLLRDFSKERLDSGHRADVIEAVAEGVIFNSFDLLMDTHINRMVVLRPKLTEKEKKAALSIVFALLGSGYDFKFDFNDGSYQCCTEVIYRALNSRGGCNFSLVKRMGTMTLSADDILGYYYTTTPRPFEMILYAEKSLLPGNYRAQIYTGDEGTKRLKKLIEKKNITMSEN